MIAAHQPWSTLLPADTTFALRNTPSWLDWQTAGDGGDVLLAWNANADALYDADRYDAVVLFDPTGAGARQIAALGFEHIRRFGVLPSLRSARWLVPLGRAAVAGGTVDAFCVAYRPRGRVLGAAARLVARSGLPLWRHQIVVGLRERPWIETLFRTVLARDDVHVGLASGEWGLRLAPTAAAFDAGGRALAFAKLGASGASSGLLRHEAAILRALRTRIPGAAIAPELLYADERDGRFVMIQSAIKGRAVGLEMTPAHTAFLRRLTGGAARRASETELVRSLTRRVAAYPEVARRFTRASAILGDTVLPATITHGDFAPHNLRTRHGEILAFDWENATLDGLPLIDVLHHELQVGFVLRDWSVERAFARLLELTSDASLPRESALALAAVYLVDMYVRRVDREHVPTPTWTPEYRERYAELLSRVDGMLPA